MTTAYVEKLDDILGEAARAVRAVSPQSVYEAVISAGVTAFRDDGKYLYYQPVKDLYANGVELFAALSKGSQTYASILQLLAAFDAATAAHLAGRVAELGTPDGVDEFHRAAKNAAVDVLWKHAHTLPLETILDYGAKGHLYGTDPKTILDLPELHERAARLEVFRRTLDAPAKTGFLTRLRDALGAELTAAGDGEFWRLLIATWRDVHHSHRGFADQLLWKLGTPEVFELFASHLDVVADRYRAIGAILTLRPERSADELIPRFFSKDALSRADGAKTADSCLSALEKRMGEEKLRTDPRWVDALVGLLSAKFSIRYGAKQALSRMDPDAVTAGLERAGLTKPAKKKLSKPKPPEKLDFLARYKAGEHGKVWDELRALEASVHDEPLQKEARAVALETMKRFKSNLERVVQILKRGNYKLRDPKKAVSPAKPDAAKKIAALEKLLKGPLPLSIRAFYETFESVSLAEDVEGDYTEGSDFELLGQKDPLMLVPLAAVLADLKQQKTENEPFPAALREPLRAYLSPTWLAKSNIPGDEDPDDDPLRMPVPDPTMDGIVQTRERPDAFFVDYLRECLSAGGFRQLLTETGQDAKDAITALVQGLEPF